MSHGRSCARERVSNVALGEKGKKSAYLNRLSRTVGLAFTDVTIKLGLLPKRGAPSSLG